MPNVTDSFAEFQYPQAFPNGKASEGSSLVLGSNNYVTIDDNKISSLRGQLSYDASKSVNALTNVGGEIKGGQSSLSIVALRNAVALQRYKEIQLANDVDFVSQIEAHFGVRPKCSDTVSRFIGGSSSMIDINPRVNSNLVDENQATLKAAPTGNGGAHIKFTADTYGVVLGIYRCTPILDYAHLGIDRTLLKTDAADFVIPEVGLCRYAADLSL